jgi:hypothetical protein
MATSMAMVNAVNMATAIRTTVISKGKAMVMETGLMKMTGIMVRILHKGSRRMAGTPDFFSRFATNS